METVNNSKATYEKTAKDVKVKHTAHIDEMMKTVTDTKIKEVDKVYDPAFRKLSVQAETTTSYLQKVEKSLQRANDLLEIRRFKNCL